MLAEQTRMQMPNEKSAKSRGSPFRTLRWAVVQLAVIVAPAAWLVPLGFLYQVDVAGPSVLQFLALTALGTLPVLICLVTIWGALSAQRLSVSLLRAAAQLAAIYLATMGVMATDSSLQTLPAVVALALGAFVAPPLVVSLPLRWFRWRLARPHELENPAAARYQFRLADVFAWMTLIAVFLGLGTAVRSHFNQEPTGWESLGPLIIVLVSAAVCLPTGIISVILAWLVLSPERRFAHRLVAFGLAILWAGFCVYVLFLQSPQPFSLNPDGYSLLMTPPALGLPALILLGLARAAGWRMQRIARRTTTPRPAPAAAIAAAGTLP